MADESSEPGFRPEAASGQEAGAEAGSDPENTAYTPKLASVFDGRGRPTRYQREKYAPVVNAILRHAGKGRAPDSIRLLDVGVGYGVFLRLCRDYGMADLHGMDPFPASMAIARRYSTACFSRGRIEDDPWPVAERGPFDAVTCLDVVEHLAEPSVFFRNVRKVLAPHATVVVRTPLFGLAYRTRGIPIVGLPDKNETHISLKKPGEWRRLAKAGGFRIAEEWRGEHLTHMRPMELFGAGLRRIGVDHRRVPLLRSFEQAYVMVMKP